jgi:microsomal dipeptidase-like Zn-dependent dipeptidase
MIADLHCHPTINPYNCTKNIWDHDPPKMRQRDNMLNTLVFSDFTQGDFTSLGTGDVRLVFVSFYPIEQRFLSNLFTSSQPNHTIRELIRIGLYHLLAHRPEDILARVIFNMPPAQRHNITDHNHEYFTEFMQEYLFFVSSIANSAGSYKIKIVTDYAELQAALNLDSDLNPHPTESNLIIVVLTLEGMHALGSGQFNTVPAGDADELSLLNDITNPWTANLLNKLKTNLTALKKLNGGKHSPFFATFSHHYWNQLCGHSMSLAGFMHKAFNQELGINVGMTKVGEEVVRLMLDKTIGRRILLDIKHMSIEGRKWYYHFLKTEYPTENIPIIASHMGMNGNVAMIENDKCHQVMDVKYNNESETFNNWDINLSDDEILTIHNSRGVIGLNFDQRILSGKKMVEFLSGISKRLVRQGVASDDILYRSVWAEPILNNWLHIITTINKAYPQNENEKTKAWELVCIGSDFDGMVNALDAFCNSGDFKQLKFILVEKMKLRQGYDPILQGRNIEQLVDGFLSKNALKFLQRNF